MKTKRHIKIVIVEDDLYYNRTLTKFVQDFCATQNYPEIEVEIKSYLNGHDCIRELTSDIDIMILDYYLMNLDENNILNGGDVVDAVNKKCPNCRVIVVSALKNVQIAVRLMRNGIYEFINKGSHSTEQIGDVLDRVLSVEMQEQKR